MKRLGDHTSIDGPKLIFFISSFCSKCMANRKQLRTALNKYDVRESNIANLDNLQQIIKPEIIPTLTIIDSNGRVIYFKEGLISKNEATSLAKLWMSLKD